MSRADRSDLIDLQEVVPIGNVTFKKRKSPGMQERQGVVTLRESAGMGVTMDAASRRAEGDAAWYAAQARERADSAKSEAQQLATQYELGRTLGLSEAGAVEFARGRSSMSTAQTKALIESANVPSVDPARSEVDGAEKLERAFGEIGLSESAAKRATRGR